MSESLPALLSSLVRKNEDGNRWEKQHPISDGTPRGTLKKGSGSSPILVCRYLPICRFIRQGNPQTFKFIYLEINKTLPKHRNCQRNIWCLNCSGCFCKNKNEKIPLFLQNHCKRRCFNSIKKHTHTGGVLDLTAPGLSLFLPRSRLQPFQSETAMQRPRSERLTGNTSESRRRRNVSPRTNSILKNKTLVPSLS